MTIELKPAQERLLQDAMAQGHFQTVEEAFDEALRLLISETTAAAAVKKESGQELPPRRTPQEAAASIRELRKGNVLPERVTIRDLIEAGGSYAGK